MGFPRGLPTIIVAAAGVCAGVAAVLVARDHPDLSIAGDAPLATAAQLAAGWSLVAAGLAHAARRPGGRAGGLLVAAGFAWFAVEAANPELDSALFFTAGLLLAPVLPAFVAHAGLTHATGRLRSRAEVAVVTAGYCVCAGTAGVLAAVLNDPRAQGCFDCPPNLVHLGGSPGAAADVTRLGLWLTVAWAAVAVAALLWREARTAAGRIRPAAPVLVPASAYLGLAAGANAHGLERGFISNDPTDRRLWAAMALALLALAAGSAWERVRGARMRSELADLVVDLGAAPTGRGVRDALARALGEPGIALVYRSLTREDWIDAEGRRCGVPDSESTTHLGGVALVGHRRGALQDPELVRDVAQATLPALEHERLQAELQGQLAELRASRTRIVEVGDAERRRLERDLHDGAQQRLVALLLDLRLARRRAARTAPALEDELERAGEELKRAIAELREVAHGLHPHTLQESGLAAAVLALAEGDQRLAIEALPDERADPAAEFAAYQVIAETLRRVPAGPVDVRGARDGHQLVVEVRADRLPATLAFLEDRVAALDGRLVVESGEARATLRAELPCAS